MCAILHGVHLHLRIHSLRARFGLLLCPVFTAATAAAVPVSFTFHCDANEPANAVYQLACLGGQVVCTKAVFERFWHETLHWTAADQQELDAWNAVLGKVESAAGAPQAAPYVGNYRAFFPGVEARLAVLQAALDSTSLSAFQHRTERWLRPDEAARLQRSIAHFRERLAPWRRRTAVQAVNARVPQTEKALRTNVIAALAEEVAAFVEAESPAREIYVHLIPSPDAKSEVATGTFISNHCLVEATDAATPEGIASVCLHELTHYLYEMAQDSKRLELMQQFVRAEVPHAAAFYALMNEAIASAVQGVLNERLRGSRAARSDDDEYRHAFIPRLARSTVPILGKALAKGSTLYQGFTQAYLREAMRELGLDVAYPKFFLNSAAILPTDKAASAYDVFLKEFQPVGFIKSEQWRLFPYMNLVFLHTYDELEGFSKAFPDLAAYTSKRGFVYTGSRDGHAGVFILAGADAEALVDVVKAFARIESVPPSGLVLSID